MLQSLVRAGHQFSSTYGGGMSNHLPMALVALSRLGAGDERLQAFYQVYVRRLDAKRTDEAATAARYRQKLGDAGVESTLRELVPRLIAGMAGDPFHGVIRLAYALMMHDEKEIAEALAAAERERRELPVSVKREWDDIARTAAARDDDHVLKLVFTAREEDRVYALPLYRFVAARKAGCLW